QSRPPKPTPRFRTIQVWPKDLPPFLRQLERAVDRHCRGGGEPMSGLKRREVITPLGGAAARPPAAAARQAAEHATTGILGYSSPSAASTWVAAFVQRMRELGWIENRDIAIEYRWAEGRIERLAEIAAEFVQLKVRVIVTYGTPGALAAKQATSVIPIVFA